MKLSVIRKFSPFLVFSILFLIVVLPGCSWLGVKPTADEQARIAIGGMQTVLPVLKTAGDAFVLAQPQYAEPWKAVAIPGFVGFNQFLGGLEAQGASGHTISVSTVIIQAQPQILSIVNMIAAWGAIPSGPGGNPTPQQTALLIAVALAQGTLLIDQMQGYLNGNIPTWEVIQAQNAIFQSQLTGGVAKIKRLKR